MQKNKKFTLNDGDSALILRHTEDDGGMYTIEVVHYFPTNVIDEELSLFYRLLMKGLTHRVISDMDKLIVRGTKAYIEDDKDLSTLH